MSDKTLIQQELADRIGRLIHYLPQARACLFVQVANETMMREWVGIDRLRCADSPLIFSIYWLPPFLKSLVVTFVSRMDKFMSLVRKSLFHLLKYARDRGWKVFLCSDLRI